MSEDGVPSVTDTPFEPPVPETFGDAPEVVEQSVPRRWNGVTDSILPHEFAEHDAQVLAEGHGLYDSEEMPQIRLQQGQGSEQAPLNDVMLQQFLSQRAMATFMGVQQDLQHKTYEFHKERAKAQVLRRNGLKEHQGLEGANSAGGGGVAA